jgi:hypothetical protein
MSEGGGKGTDLRVLACLQSTGTVEVTHEGVTICARCAHALGKGNHLMLTALEFESASQIGSHASYPQWGSEGTNHPTPFPSCDRTGIAPIGLESSSAEQPYEASERDPETCSDVTLQSHDTWGGLAPPAPLEAQISDEVCHNNCHFY